MKRNIWTSRKFWISVAAMLASLGTSVSGIVQGNQTLAVIGSVCTVVSGALYAFFEKYQESIPSPPVRSAILHFSKDDTCAMCVISSAL